MATESVPWNREDLDEWRCPTCARESYTPKSRRVLMLACTTCPGLVLMERLQIPAHAGSPSVGMPTTAPPSGEEGMTNG